MIRRTGLLLVALILVIGILAGCTGTEEMTTYKVGVIAAQTGPYSALGLPALEGMRIVEEEINKAGGINGKPLELIIYDDKSSSTETALAAKKLIEVDQVLAFACSSATGLSHSIVPIANEMETPGIPMSGTNLIDDQLGKWAFKPIAGELKYIPLPLGYLKGDHGVTKLAGLMENSGYGEGGEHYLKLMAPDLGVDLVDIQHFDPTATDLTPQLTNIRNSDAEAIFIWGSGPAGALAIKQAREMEIDLHIVTTPAQSSPHYTDQFMEFYETEPSTVCLDSKLTMWRQLPDEDPAKELCKDFDELYTAKHGRSPSMWAAIGAQIVQFIADGLERADIEGSDVTQARDALRIAFENTNEISLFMGVYTVTPEDHFGQVIPRDVLVTFKNGEKVLQKTFEQL